MKNVFLHFLIVVIYCVHGYSQITYHDINPDTTVSVWDAFIVQPFGGGTAGNSLDIWWHPTPEVVVTTWNDFQLLCSGTGIIPAKLNAGDSITAGANWQSVIYQPLNSGGTGNWQIDANDKYLGFRLKNGSVWNYGWLKLTVAANAASFTVKEWAFNNTGHKINAGQTNGTGITLLNVPNTDMCLFPNPATDYIKVTLLSEATNELIVYDQSGRDVFHSSRVKGSFILPVIDFAYGVYLVRWGKYTRSFIRK
jgi:hypothetical protein